MEKKHKIIYWVATLWLSLGMLSAAIVQLAQVSMEMESIKKLGYPGYLLTIVGLWKILGVIAILIPGYPLLKEWAYAGFFFMMTGAIFSHLAAGETINSIFPSLLLLVLTLISWHFRPSDRRIAVSKA